MMKKMMTARSDIIPKPWGFERIIEKNDNYVVKLLFVKAHSRLSLQYHREKVETMFLVDGQADLEMYLDGDKDSWSKQSMAKMAPYYIEPGVIHRLSTGKFAGYVIEVSSTELDDVVRIKDDYGRTQD